MNGKTHIEPLENRLRRLRSQKKATAFTAKVLKASKKTSMANEFLTANDTLVMYVRDKFGFKKGVVIATGPGVIGWSLVSTRDYETIHLDIEQVPRLARYIHKPALHTSWIQDENDELTPKDALDALVKDSAFKEWASGGGWVNCPCFDKDTGLTLAINKMKALEAVTGPDKGLSIEDVDIPHDEALREAIKTMILRSHRYFFDKPHAFETRDSFSSHFESYHNI